LRAVSPQPDDVATEPPRDRPTAGHDTP